MVGRGMAVNAEEILAGASLTSSQSLKPRDSLISGSLRLFQDIISRKCAALMDAEGRGSAFKHIYLLNPFSVALSIGKHQPSPGVRKLK